MVEIEQTGSWYVVWYWEDEIHFVNQKFLDYEDAVEFVKELKNETDD